MDNLTMEQQQVVEEKSNVANVDFRMVTFTLAGRDYAIDIMKVKEISKDNKFTYVPNAAPFVVGVYNLRGDIISVIDLRVFFNQMNSHDRSTARDLENMIILRLEDHTIAVIVDTIDKVVGIPSETIQPPHPLFGDINVKYISGIVESENKLYVILDVERIFNSEETDSLEPASMPVVADIPVAAEVVGNESEDELNIKFISESLATFNKMHVTSVNMDWVRERYSSWSKGRRGAGKEVQFQDENDAYKFMEPFHSPYTGNLWDNDYIEAVKKLLPQDMGSTFYILNGGCGNGLESYSLASIVKKTHPGTLLKILAYDNDLMAISTAPSLNIDKDFAPEFYRDQLVESVSGSWQFNEGIRNSVIFEYHDMVNNANLPALDFVVIRDLLSLLKPEAQMHVISLVMENLKPGGVLMVGKHEKIDVNMGFEEQVVDGINVYIKK
ncbi:MAG: chemotaxis protein CheW [Spirochaetales bacterium]|nr:chemotaxis protein CheW [Spirochaetales bacterium]